MDLSELGLDKDLSKALKQFGLEQDLARIASDVNALEAQVDDVVVTELSPDRLVKVTVDGRSDVRELALDPGIYAKQDAEALAATILATIQRAVATASAKTEAICDEWPGQRDG